jgi:hypothetical protein
LLLLPIGAGCGADPVKVSGRVLLNGQPLPGGRVTFRPSDPRHTSVKAGLDEQGHYEAMLPVGAVSVSVDNRELEPPVPQGLGGPPKGLPLRPDVKKVLSSGIPGKSAPNAPDRPPGKYVKIPGKYYAAETSGLEFIVEPGGQTHDIELKK